MNLKSVIVSIILVFSFLQLKAQQTANKINLNEWNLVWQDEFDYSNKKLDQNWESQNGPSGHILCSRWRENAVVKNGVLELQARKENRGGQEWTAGNIWTKRRFGYGYFESRYKYAGAAGTNNSFWLMPQGVNLNTEEIVCELDINEGHFPNEVNTDRHHHQSGGSYNGQLGYTEGLSPAYAHSFNNSIKTKRIRFSSNNSTHFHLREFRIYETNNNCYPTNLLSDNADSSVSGLKNLALEGNVEITASGVLRDEFKVNSVADGSLSSSWVSQKTGEKWLEFSWPSEQSIGHIQFINGWQKDAVWHAFITDYKIEAEVNGEWVELANFDVETKHNYAEEYHVYGVDWNVENVKFYFDNKLIRTLPNTECTDDLNIWLSLAILEHAGEVTDAIDGTSMKVDYVKYYQKK
ncbi:family 16 glycosylhydrolase [uncultured Lutibacter sp.]|uniref:family 16 glycosylhydrolase n=1 Tax=uncultured Lutibacter sp. TaxID=437739 RepID=UPI002603280E|nr:family 16 glycosylhydrolase [uncultured Lutibacter sp.]